MNITDHIQQLPVKEGSLDELFIGHGHILGSLWYVSCQKMLRRVWGFLGAQPMEALYNDTNLPLSSEGPWVL